MFNASTLTCFVESNKTVHEMNETQTDNTEDRFPHRCVAGVNRFGSSRGQGNGADRCRHRKKSGSAYCGIHADGHIRAEGRNRMFYLSERQFAVLQEWAAREGLRSRSEALRDILDRLAADMGVEA